MLFITSYISFRESLLTKSNELAKPSELLESPKSRALVCFVLILFYIMLIYLLLTFVVSFFFFFGSSL